jgi:hypothetical protein
MSTLSALGSVDGFCSPPLAVTEYLFLKLVGAAVTEKSFTRTIADSAGVEPRECERVHGHTGKLCATWLVFPQQ